VSRLALPAVLLVTIVMITPLCGLSFRCGCEPLWASGYTHCNVGREGEPHCPWCEQPTLGAVGGGLTLLVQSAAFAFLRRRGGSRLRAAFVALVLLPPAFFASAGLTWLATDYPHLFGQDARSRLGVPPGPLHCGGGG
jgi:hypothetical protein